MGVDPSPHSSIRRKIKGGIGGLNLTDTHGGPSHRQSLAFELAAAMEPEENDQASILDQLGLGDDDDDQPMDQTEEEEEEEEEEGDADIIYEEGEYDSEQYADQPSLAQQLQEPRLRLQPSRATVASTHTQHSTLSNELDLSPRKSSIRGSTLFTPIRAPKSKVSRSTLNTIDSSPQKNSGIIQIDQLTHPTSDQDENSSTEIDDDGKHDITFGAHRTHEDFDSSEEEQDDEILQAGLKSTARFLNLLKQSNTDCNVTLRQNPTNTHASHTTEETQPDRQPIVEKMITDIVRTMTEQVRDRESQIRELKEIEIALSRTDRRALAELDALPNVLEEADFRNSTILGKFTAPPDHSSIPIDASSKSIEDLERHPSMEDEEEEEVEENEELEGGRLTPTNGRHTHRTQNETNLHEEEEEEENKTRMYCNNRRLKNDKAIENLGELKIITNSLISSLNQIHEHTQISRQTQIEIVRKLKGVKGLVFNWKSDFDNIQNSIDFISNWESNLFPTTTTTTNNNLLGEGEEKIRLGANKIRGVFEVQLKVATEEVEKLLNDAFINASKLLEPQPISPSFNPSSCPS